MVDNHLYNLLIENSSPADRAGPLSVSSPSTLSWVLVIPYEGGWPSSLAFGIPGGQQVVFQVLTLLVAQCVGSVLDPLAHHAPTLTSVYGQLGMSSATHNKLGNTHAEACVLRMRQKAASLTSTATHVQP